MRASSPLALPIALVLACAALPAFAGEGSKPPPARDSLEELLERARKQRQIVQDKLRGDVQGLVKELETEPEPKRLSELVEKLVALGQEATPLLVRYLDPGDAPADNEKLRAVQVSAALSRMDTTAVTSELLELLEKGGLDTKRNTLRVLQTSPEVARTQPAVEKLFRSAEGSIRQTALRTLITMGGPALDTVLGEVLVGADENLIGIAIEGLATSSSESAVVQVRKLLAQPAAAARHALSLIAFFKVNPKLITSQDIAAFVKVAQQASVPLDTRVAVIDALAALDPDLNAEFKKSMESIVGAADRRLREAGLILLAKLGDKNSERELVKEFDELVAKNDRWAEAYVRRADMYARIGDDDKAIKDFKEAIAVGRDDPTLQTDTYEKLARAQVRKGRLKDAADTLNKAPLSRARLRELYDDPEFAPLRNSKYAKDAFALGS